MSFDWNDDLLVGDRQMDDNHREFVELVGAMLDASDDQFLQALQRFSEHATRHFGEEDHNIRSTAYPSGGCHVDEHAAVLASVSEVLALVAQGNIAIGRDLAAELARWFPEHTREMDQGVAKWMVQKRTGGAPIVIKKRAAEA